MEREFCKQKQSPIPDYESIHKAANDPHVSEFYIDIDVRKEFIYCPVCGMVQEAEVWFDESTPFPEIKNHSCISCEEKIDASRWFTIPKDLIAKVIGENINLSIVSHGGYTYVYLNGFESCCTYWYEALCKAIMKKFRGEKSGS